MKKTDMCEIECCVCYERVFRKDKLECGHYVHVRCIQKTLDFNQEYRYNNGFPEIEHGSCPVCRAPVEKVKPKFFNTIKINMNEIDSKNIKSSIFQNISNRNLKLDPEELLNIVNTLECVYSQSFIKTPKAIDIKRSGNIFSTTCYW